LNKSSVQRGLFSMTRYYVYMTKVMTDESICIPTNEMCFIRDNTSKLDDDGIISVGARVKKGDVLVGKVSFVEKNGQKIFQNESLVFDVKDEIGTISNIQISTSGDAYTMIKVKIAVKRDVEMGDKFSSRHGQKGTCGMLFSQWDLPFNHEGLTPDIIINPLCLPSRMTIGQLIECLFGKAALHFKPDEDLTVQDYLDIQDGTTFDDGGWSENNEPRFIKRFRKVKSVLRKAGLQPEGSEQLIDGMKGDALNALVFMGPVFYQRLKHMVIDKIHARGRGKKHTLTRGPVEGRSANGGFRIGGMERNCMTSQGGTEFIRDRMYVNSDPYEYWVCKKCGVQGIHDELTNTKECHLCGGNDLYLMKVPYCTKLLMQMLAGIGISVKCIKEN
jgi:DNA-directed RNA polymerase II subunit RPB2